MVISMSTLVFLYVWQNIEVIRIEIDYKKLAKDEKRLLKENDLLRSKIESYRRLYQIEKRAESKGYAKIKPGDVDVLEIKRGK